MIGKNVHKTLNLLTTMNNFDLKKYLAENKLTANSKAVNEIGQQDINDDAFTTFHNGEEFAIKVKLFARPERDGNEIYYNELRLFISDIDPDIEDLFPNRDLLEVKLLQAIPDDAEREFLESEARQANEEY